MKILVAMSGGVDSSMTAKMLLEAGYEVIGCYAKLHNKPNYHEENIRKVKKVSEFLGIKYHILDLQDAFEEAVFGPFISAYEAGITPNPCAICNRQIKFGRLWEFAKELDCGAIATGHYAQIVQKDGVHFLKTAADPSKDQSYFLANIDPKILAHITFPLGDKFKADIKAAAAKIPQIAELATQKESSEICFVETTYLEVLRQRVNPDKMGVVRNSAGEAIGEHFGYMHYTVGKRKGFRINGAHEPHFVLSTDAAKNEIIVGKRDELKCFFIKTSNFNDFRAVSRVGDGVSEASGGVSRVGDGAGGEGGAAGGAGGGVNEAGAVGGADDKMAGQPFEAFVKIRYRSPKIPCSVMPLASGGAEVTLHENAGATAKGQLAVFYSADDLVLASGFIA